MSIQKKSVNKAQKNVTKAGPTRLSAKSLTPMKQTSMKLIDASSPILHSTGCNSGH
jgi:hypothetical protein